MVFRMMGVRKLTAQRKFETPYGLSFAIKHRTQRRRRQQYEYQVVCSMKRTQRVKSIKKWKTNWRNAMSNECESSATKANTHTKCVRHLFSIHTNTNAPKESIFCVANLKRLNLQQLMWRFVKIAWMLCSFYSIFVTLKCFVSEVSFEVENASRRTESVRVWSGTTLKGLRNWSKVPDVLSTQSSSQAHLKISLIKLGWKQLTSMHDACTYRDSWNKRVVEITAGSKE